MKSFRSAACLFLVFAILFCTACSKKPAANQEPTATITTSATQTTMPEQDTDPTQATASTQSAATEQPNNATEATEATNSVQTSSSTQATKPIQTSAPIQGTTQPTQAIQTTAPTQSTKPTQATTPAFDTPILRFAVTSDTHIRDASDNMESYERLESFYQTVYAYADAQKDYKKLDGIFFVGDLTDGGTEKQYTYFFDSVKKHARSETTVRAVLGNHDFWATGKYSAVSIARTADNFLEYSGYDAVDAHLVIGGYHFIFVSMDKYDKTNYVYFSTAKLAWLKQELDAAVADDPTKPIFVFQHEPPQSTIVARKVLGDVMLTALLSNYPQVIDFSGHTHQTMADTRSIWQGSFTALGTGSLAYLSLRIPDGTRNNGGATATDFVGGYDVDNGDSIRNGGMYYIVEIDENGVVRISIYDMFTQSIWGEPYIIDSVDPAKFRYTDARQEVSDKPVFGADATITLVSANYKNVNISFPEATSKDIVQGYRVELYEGDTLVQTQHRLSTVNFGGNGTLKAYQADLKPATGYTFKIYAINSWAKESDPLVLNFTTTA